MLKLLVLVALAFLSFRRKDKSHEESIIFDKLCTNQLKGLAIILVIMGHLSVDKHIFIIPNMIYAGAWGVTLFLILSGFGLTKSYLKNGLSLNTLFRRIKTILIPYSIVTLIWILIDILYYGKNYSPKIITLSLLGINPWRSIDASMWYISIILFWYAIFYISFRLPIKHYMKVFILLCFSYIIARGHFSSYLLDLTFNWQLSSFSFPIGVFWGLYFDKVKGFFTANKLKNILFILTCTFFSLFILLIKYNGSTKCYVLTNTLFSLSLISLVIILRYYKTSSLFLEFIGSISYELYLFEGALMWKYSLLRIYNNKLVSFTLYFGSIIIISYIYNKLSNRLINIRWKDVIQVPVKSTEQRSA